MAEFLPFFFLLVLSHCVWTTKSEIFNVVEYGAVGDGLKEDTNAFMDAWNATCNSNESSPTMVVPGGKTFLLQPLTFNGRYSSKNITVLIDGEIIAPKKPSAWRCNGKKCKQWILFLHFNRLNIHGSGTINGHGKKWWHHPCNHNKRLCGKKPTGFVVEHSKNVYLNGLTFKDSPQMHITFERSSWVYISNLNIQAPHDSPNTDGIHIQQTQHVFIHHNQISTGDDCISIGAGSSHLNISNINCGPGHGISIGSLGEKGKEESVEFVHVKDVIFTGTTNGARIKTWQGGRGYARNIIFEKIISRGSTRPIIIDQFYCEHNHCKNQTSGVNVSNVWYNQITGTSHTDIAIEFACSESTPCTNIFTKDIDLHSAKSDGNELEASSYCSNVHGNKNGTIPDVSCLDEGIQISPWY